MLILLWSSSALAWEFAAGNFAYAWDTTAPVVWSQTDYELAGLPPGATAQIVRDAFAVWDIACVGGLAFEEGPLVLENKAWWFHDDQSVVSFDDPWDELEPGVLAGTLVQRIDPGFVLAGETVHWAEEGDIMTNDGVAWLTDDAAADPACAGGYSLRAALAHEVGHFLGLGHSDEVGATMHVDAVPACSTEAVSLTDDDRVGVQLLHQGVRWQPWCEIPGTVGTIGPVPLDVVCDIEAWGEPTELSATWEIDGAPLEGAPIEHTFQAPGAWTMSGCATSTDDACIPSCGTWEVLACAAPAVALRVEDGGDGTWVLRNETPIEVDGCVTSVAWTILRGEDVVLTSVEWEPTIALDRRGEYVVRLAVGGPGGLSVTESPLVAGAVADEAPDVEQAAEPEAGCGCRTSGAGGAWWVLVVALAAQRRRSGHSHV